jgi:Uncharacterised protein family (UPF0158)
MIELHELESAVMYVSGNGGMENDAYLNRETGEIFYDSPDAEGEEGLPDDVDDDTKYVRIPNERDLDLGIPLRLDFIRQHAPDSYEEAFHISRRPKAYGRLRDLLERTGLIETWYSFQREALYNSLKQWCADNQLELAEPPCG